MLWVEWNEEDATFTLTVEDLRAKKTLTEVFDHVIVATGHFSFPNVPDFDGIGRFPGEIIYAHEFRGALLRRFGPRVRRGHPLHRLPAPLPVPAGRAEHRLGQQPLPGRSLPRHGVAEEPAAVLPRRPGPVVHLHHVRRPGLVRP
ncbi:MAG: hypothetical protein L0L92_11690 [Corynebacterium variabile]|nr:hypothetical protein [Corynebacterium variabile]